MTSMDKFLPSILQRFPVLWLWLLIALVSFVMQAAGWVDDWRYDRGQIEAGKLWLLLSGHLVHLNWSHWVLNMAGLGIVAFFFSRYEQWQSWLLLCLLSALCIGVGMYFLKPDIQYYVGLSGVLHGLFVYGAWQERKVYPTSGYVLLILIGGKLLWEILYGAVPGSEEWTGGRVLTEAHLYGACSAAGLILLESVLKGK